MADMKLKIVGTFKDLISPKLKAVQKNLNALNVGLAATAGKMQKDLKQSADITSKSFDGLGTVAAAAVGSLAAVGSTLSKLKQPLPNTSFSDFTESLKTLKSSISGVGKAIKTEFEAIKLATEGVSLRGVSLDQYKDVATAIKQDLKPSFDTLSSSVKGAGFSFIELGKTGVSVFGRTLKNSLIETGALFKETFSQIVMGAKTATAALLALGGIGIVNTNRQFETLKASLEAVTNSSEEATGAFEFIKDVSKTIPGDVAQTTQAFIKLKALGLNPSREALESYANTSSAMGKSLMQMIEAVADASTMEFERLKEFGIKARQQKDTVDFTFRGVTTSVKKNSQDIQRYLLNIGKVEFAGAAARQMETLDGQLSNLKVAFQEFAERFNEETGMMKFLSGALKSFTGVTEGANSMFLKIRLVFAAIGKSFGELWINFKSTAMKSIPAIIGGFKDVGVGISNFFIGLTNDVIDMINSMTGAVVKGVNTLIQKINKLPKVNIPTLSESANQITRIEPIIRGDEEFNEFNEMLKDQQRLLKENQEFWDGFADYAIDIETGYRKASEAGKEYEKVLKKEEEQLVKNNKAEEERAKAAERLKERLMEIGQQFESIFSDFFMDIMNDSGNAFRNLADNFKNAIDRMVADALAARLVQTLFGDLVGGTTGGLLGGGLQNAITRMFGREQGGPVQRGMPYIVGEKRPELFVPNQDGTILPDLSMAGGGTTNVSIQAIDSRGVADFIEQNKFAFAGAVQTSKNRYNVG